MARSVRPHLAWIADDTPGAWARVGAIAPRLASRCTVLSVAEPPLAVLASDLRVLQLPRPVRVSARRPVLGDAALGLGSVAAARLATFVADDAPDLVLADGLPHAALFARQCGVATTVVHRHGRRDDPARAVLERALAGFLAPYPAVLEPADTPPEVRRRTVHAGYVSRFADQRADPTPARRALGLDPTRSVVTVISGRDGLGLPDGALAEAAAATPERTWLVLGRGRADVADGGPSADLHRLGWSLDPWQALAAADVVVAGAGLSTVAEVASAGRPLLAMARPGRQEDREHLAALTEVGAATALHEWPDAGTWPHLLAGCDERAGRRLSRLDDGRGAERAASWLDAWAEAPPGDLAGAADDLQVVTSDRDVPRRDAEVVDLTIAARASRDREPVVAIPPPSATAAEP